MSRASRRMNRQSAIRANNSKVSRTSERDVPISNNKQREEKQRILEKYGLNKYTY